MLNNPLPGEGLASFFGRGRWGRVIPILLQPAFPHFERNAASDLALVPGQNNPNPVGWLLLFIRGVSRFADREAARASALTKANCIY